MFRYLTAGESHGKGLTLIIDGLPAGVSIDLDKINLELARRQKGYGRGDRQKIENDQALVFSGLRFGETIGAPITLHIPNRDWKNHRRTMSTEPLAKGNSPIKEMTVPRPGHADLAGWYKYGRKDLRDIWEQSSARDTAAQAAAGAIARQVLEHFGVRVASHVIRVGKAAIEDPDAVTLEQVEAIPARSSLHCADRILEKVMESQVDRAGKAGDTLGGAFQVLAGGVIPGLGCISHTGEGIDARLTSALMSVPSVKGVEIGYGVRGVLAGLSGQNFHDPIQRETGQKTITRGSNRAGGIEGGLSNGELIRITAYVKPISTMGKPLDSIDLQSGKKRPSESPRSDVCVLPSAGVVGEAQVLLTLLRLYLETFGGDTFEEMVASYRAHLKKIEERLPEVSTVVVPREEPVPMPEPKAEPAIELKPEPIPEPKAVVEPVPEVKSEPDPVVEAEPDVDEIPVEIVESGHSMPPHAPVPKPDSVAAVPPPAEVAPEPAPVAPPAEPEPSTSETPPEPAPKARRPYFLPRIDPKPQE